MAATKIMIDGVQYDSIKKASEIIGKSPGYISTRLNSNDPKFKGWQRLPAEPQKPKPKGSPEDETRFTVITTRQKRTIAEMCFQIMNTEPREFYDKVLKVFALNTVSYLEDQEPNTVDPDRLRDGIMAAWDGRPRNVGPDVIPADLFE